MFLFNTNIWIIIASSITAMIFSYIWYAPWFFGKKWLKEWGNEDEGSFLNHFVSFCFILIMSFVINSIFNSFVVLDLKNIIITVLFLWTGFVLPVLINNYLYGKKSMPLLLISSGHYLIIILVISLFSVI